MLTSISCVCATLFDIELPTVVLMLGPKNPSPARGCGDLNAERLLQLKSSSELCGCRFLAPVVAVCDRLSDKDAERDFARGTLFGDSMCDRKRRRIRRTDGEKEHFALPQGTQVFNAWRSTVGLASGGICCVEVAGVLEDVVVISEEVEDVAVVEDV